MTLRSYIAALGATLALAACTDDLYPDPSGGTGSGDASDIVCFGISAPAPSWPDEAGGSRGADTTVGSDAGRFVLRATDNGADTLCVAMTVDDFDADGNSTPSSRAALVSGFGNMHGSFGVCGYMTPVSNENWTTYFSNEKNNKPAATGDPWVYDRTDITYFWPGKDFNMRFFAYAPYDEGKGFVTFKAPATSAADPQLGLYVDTDAGKQTDLLVATATAPGDNNAAVPLTFKHVCTAVQFVVGDEMQPGSIVSISLKGIYRSGTYADGAWTVDTSQKTDFTQRFDIGTGKPTHSTDKPGTPITDDTACLVMLPQTLPDGAEFVLEFADAATGTNRIFTAPIGGQTWPAGARVKYSISITPGYNFELVDAPEAIDAHYVICRTTLRVTGVAADVGWKLTAPQLGGESASIIAQADMNEFAKDGYWTDRKTDRNGKDAGSARGGQTFSGKGSGDFPIAIFIPENASTAARDVNLEVTFDSQKNSDLASVKKTLTISQLCPVWAAGGSGWEQIDDGQSGMFGFCWDRKIMYLIPYATIGESGNIQDKARDIAKALITEYNADTYAHLSSFHYYTADNIFSRRDTYRVDIDYSQIKLTGDFTNDIGLENTRQLLSVNKGVSGEEFETVLTSLTKENAGETDNTKDDKLFRIPSSGKPDENSNEISYRVNRNCNLYLPSGNNSPKSGILMYVERKNAFDYVETYTNGIYVWYPIMKELKWYLPAKDEFHNVPTDIKDPITASGCWSSTPILTADEAYTGAGAAVARTSINSVRACRRPL